MTNRRFCSSSVTTILLLFIVSAVAADSNSDECVYTLYVKTGSMIKSGTDSKISVQLGDAEGRSVVVPNLEEWGLMGSDHDYYEWGNLDIFTGRGSCVGTPLCRLNITSDGSRSHHGWFCDYVEVTSTGPHKTCGRTNFYVQQWLSEDAPPYQLSAVLDGCAQQSVMGAQKAHVRNEPLVVRNLKGEGPEGGVASQ